MLVVPRIRFGLNAGIGATSTQIRKQSEDSCHDESLSQWLYGSTNLPQLSYTTLFNFDFIVVQARNSG